MEEKKIVNEELNTVAGGVGSPELKHVFFMPCKEHSFIDNRSICVPGEGQYSEKKCTECGMLKYFNGYAEITKKEFEEFCAKHNFK